MVHLKHLLVLFCLLSGAPFLLGQNDNSQPRSALRIIDLVREKQAGNTPESILDSYHYTTYQKTLITADPDAIKGETDSIFTRKKGQWVYRTTDSTALHLKQDMEDHHLYLAETTTEIAYDQFKGRQETINASKTAGVDRPFYRLLSVELYRFSFYQQTYTLAGTQFHSPLGKNAHKHYLFQIVDTLTHSGRPGYVISFSPKTDSEHHLTGTLYIDMLSFAIQKGMAHTSGNIDLTIAREYQYFQQQDVWFPGTASVEIRKGHGKMPVPLFDKLIDKSWKKYESSYYRHNNRQPLDKEIRFNSSIEVRRIRTNQKVVLTGRARDIIIAPGAGLRTQEYWKEQRSEPISLREAHTYVTLDSVSEAEHLNKRSNFLNKLLIGYFPTPYVDFDLKYLLKYNNYEAFRTGMGAITNDNFSKKIRLKAYGVYGTKDDDFKYGFSAAVRLTSERETWLAVDYRDDLVETGSAAYLSEGRQFYVFEPRLFNITSFHRNKDLSTYLSHQINPALQLRFTLSQKDTEPTYNYVYQHGGNNFTTWSTTSGIFSAFWGPNNSYMVDQAGSRLLQAGFPQFNFQFTQGWEGFGDGDFTFSKVQLKAYHEVPTMNFGKFTFLFSGGYSFGDLPISELYHAYPNQPKKDALLQRFSVAGRDSFETMYFDEFFADRIFTLQAKYYTPSLKLSNSIAPHIVLISRFAVGDITHIDRHIGIPFQSLERGYYESGVEINQIFKGFGLSGLYRYGPYHLPRFDDNISFKFTFYLSLGI